MANIVCCFLAFNRDNDKEKFVINQPAKLGVFLKQKSLFF